MINEIWNNFVLNEGIMPTSIARKIKNDASLAQNSSLIASVLKKREIFNDPAYPEIMSLCRTAFQNDRELTTWLYETDDVLSIILNFHGKPEMEDLLQGAYSSFIKSCPLVSDDIKSRYLFPKTSMSDILNTRDYSSRKKNLNPKIEHFKAYLEKKLLLSFSTINSYKNAVGNLGSKLFGKDLWSIDGALEVQNLFAKYQNTKEFKKLEENTHKGFSNGLKRYIEFLEQYDK